MSVLSILTGKELYWSVISGSKKIIEHQEEINKINVFPVPDGDTGSNLAATATSIIYNSKESDSINIVASSIGDAALDGARGNSGVIFAQFLYGIGVETKGSTNLSPQKFAEIVKKASDYVYKAIPSPQEGTIITVIREWAEYIHANKDTFTDFDILFTKAEIIAQEALTRTTEQLEVLRIAKVVDAGGKGFVFFIEGIKDALLTRSFSRNDHDIEHLLMYDYDFPMAEAESLTEESLHNRYCTETCLIGENISRDAVLEILEEDSDSIVIAGYDKKLRLHFHTNKPANIFNKLYKFGNFSFQKVEDMRLQYNVTHHKKNSIAFVVDSCITLSPEFMDENQINLMPLNIHIDKVNYLDIRTIDIDLFKQYFTDKNTAISTSQPSPKSFADLFGYLSRYYESVIVLTMTNGVSGLYESALQGKELILSKKDIKIDVINSTDIAGGGGMIAHLTAKDIQDGLSHEDVVKNIHNNIAHTTNYINFQSIDHVIKSGRLGMFKGGIIKALQLCPILTMIDGKPVVIDKAFGFKNAIKKNIAIITEKSANRSIKGYFFSHAGLSDNMKEYYLKNLEEIFGCPPLENAVVSPCLVSHVGYGAISVGVTYKD